MALNIFKLWLSYYFTCLIYLFKLPYMFGHHLTWAVLVIITLLVSRPVRQHFTEPLKYCLASQTCNHTFVPECGAQVVTAEMIDLKMFTDVCDMLEYNCDNNKGYVTVNYSECFPPTFPPQFHRVGNYRFEPEVRKAIFDPPPSSLDMYARSRSEQENKTQPNITQKTCNKEEPRMFLAIRKRNYYFNWISTTTNSTPIAQLENRRLWTVNSTTPTPKLKNTTESIDSITTIIKRRTKKRWRTRTRKTTTTKMTKKVTKFPRVTNMFHRTIVKKNGRKMFKVVKGYTTNG